MKQLLFVLTCLSIASVNLFSQYSTDWIRPGDSYQKTGVMMARDNADNVIVSGFWTANNIYTRKYDKFGNQQWEVISTSGVPGNYEKPVWVNCDSSNNVFVTGYRYSLGQFNYPNALVILKYNPAGTLLWKNTIPMTIFVNNVISFNMRSEVDRDGNLYVGTVAVNPSGFVLIKLDPAGNTLFTSNNNLNGVTMFRSMRLKGDRVVFSGSSSNLSAAILVTWDTTGNALWTGSYLGQSGNDIEMDNSGNVYLLTSYPNQVSPTSGQDILIYKMNAAGSQLWVNNYDFGGYDFPTRFTYEGGRISVTGYGSISSGYFDWITFQVNTSGTKIWDARYNETTVNDEQSLFITAKTNGDVFVTGRGGPDYNLLGSNYLRMITVKYDNTGARKWVDSVNIYSGRGMACTLASDSSLYVLSDAYTTAFHFLDHTGGVPASVPIGINVSNVGNTSATFSWTPVSGAYLYHLRYKETAATSWNVVSINTPPITVSGLVPATSYDYACEAINSGGPSGYSATQSFLTGVVLPVTGLELNTQRQGRNVLLTWSTQSEQNSSHFIIERSSDGVRFNSIGQVAAAGNSSTISSYRFLDVTAPGSLTFYRLKLVDADAGFKFSSIRVVPAMDKTAKPFVVYPNPASSGATIILNEAAKENALLQVFSPAGQMVKETTVFKGMQVINFDISLLPKGMYYLKLTDSKGSQVIKLIVR